MIFFYPTVGVNYYGFLFAIFLTYAGSGSMKNIKNLAVPATVIALAVAIVSISKLFPGKEIADPYFWYSIYLFPNVLIAAKLVQGLVADKK